ncbi:anti-sigma factor [Cellulosimicrobium cellulans]|uniref:anti-sigma factor n=1 Tax=Cellulosimicrobium cellulans TaxID=1710 RepID=UPI0002D44AF3|nr:anti-sigma factor [Cellulosimicrobium cellulans]
MQHIDDETLALLALGEDVLDDDARAHLSSCPECADAVARLARVVDAFDGADPADGLVAPDAAVWSRVQAELGLTSAAAPPVVAPAAVTDAPAAPTLPRDAAGTGAEAPDSTADATGTAVVVPLAPRRRRVWVPVTAAAAAALVVGGVGGILWERRGVEPPETTVASATLDPLPDWQGASGDARVEERPDGRRQVVVTVDAPVPDGTYREVWLLAEDLSGLVSLGVLDGTEGRFDVPDGLDLAEFPVVDVSEEHFDGDPSHSGDSVVRGPLDV